MTTTVTVTTHDWPVEARTFPLNDREPVEGGEWSEPTRVEANSTREFHVHSGQDVMVRELIVTPERMGTLRRGSLIRHVASADTYVVTGHYGDRLTAVRSVDVTNPDEWEPVPSQRHDPARPEE